MRRWSKLKRTCNGCVALQDVETGKECRLEHKIECSKTGYKPLEECEKPKSYIQLFSIKK